MRCILNCSLAFTVLVAGGAGAAPPRPNAPIPPPPDEGAFLAKYLEMCRGFQTHLEGMIVLQYKVLTDLAAAFTPEQTDRLQRMLEEDKQNLMKMKRWVQALESYQQQRKLNPESQSNDEARAQLDKLLEDLWAPPSVAPMPREIKK